MEENQNVEENLNFKTKDPVACLNDTSLLGIHLLLEDDSLIAPNLNQLESGNHQKSPINLTITVF